MRSLWLLLTKFLIFFFSRSFCRAMCRRCVSVKPSSFSNVGAAAAAAASPPSLETSSPSSPSSLRLCEVLAAATAKSSSALSSRGRFFFFFLWDGGGVWGAVLVRCVCRGYDDGMGRGGGWVQHRRERGGLRTVAP